MLTIGFGQPAITKEFAAGLDMEHFAFVVCLTMFAALTVKDFFFLLLFLCNNTDMCSLLRG